MGLKLPPRVVAVPCREIGNGEKLEGTKERREGGFVITFFFLRETDYKSCSGRFSSRVLFKFFFILARRQIKSIYIYGGGGVRKISPRDESTPEKLAAYLHSNQKS